MLVGTVPSALSMSLSVVDTTAATVQQSWQVSLLSKQLGYSGQRSLQGVSL